MFLWMLCFLLWSTLCLTHPHLHLIQLNFFFFFFKKGHQKKTIKAYITCQEMIQFKKRWYRLPLHSVCIHLAPAWITEVVAVSLNTNHTLDVPSILQKSSQGADVKPFKKADLILCGWWIWSWCRSGQVFFIKRETLLIINQHCIIAMQVVYANEWYFHVELPAHLPVKVRDLP